MKNLFFIFIVLIASKEASGEDSSYLSELSEAENLWNLQSFKNYSYTLESAGAFSHTSYRISFRNGKCMAKSSKNSRIWKTDVCKGHTIRDLFAEFRQRLNSGSEIVSLEFDSELGYPKELMTEEIGAPDLGWSYNLTDFKIEK